MAALGPWDALKAQEQARLRPPAVGLAPRDITHVATTTPRREPGFRLCAGNEQAMALAFERLVGEPDVLQAKNTAIEMVADILGDAAGAAFMRVMQRVV